MIIVHIIISITGFVWDGTGFRWVGPGGGGGFDPEPVYRKLIGIAGANLGAFAFYSLWPIKGDMTGVDVAAIMIAAYVAASFLGQILGFSFGSMKRK